METADVGATPVTGELIYVEREPTQAPRGLLVLHHGRGSNEHNMLALADVLDPERALYVVAPRGPFALGDGAYRWYESVRSGYPDAPSFARGARHLAELHDLLWQVTATGPAQTILGGFSMGAVMSLALALDSTRPAPAGILAFSGYIPTVAGWQADLTRTASRIFISHGVQDELIEVGLARTARERLEQAGFDVDYGESDGGHSIEPAQLRRAVKWLAGLELAGRA